MRVPIKTIIIVIAAVGLLLAGYFQGYLHGAIGGLHGIFDQEQNRLMKHLRLDDKSKAESIGVVGQLNVTVKEKPFGMQVRLGSTVVENVFPGFPAQKLGVREGCEIRTIQGKKVTQGTYLATFQKTSTPFKMTLFCPAGALRGHGPLSVERNNFRVLVVQKPFGMDVHVQDKFPRVVNVLPGYPAEAAGVKPGFILKAVNDAPVNATNWFRIWSKAKVPCTLTFDTLTQEVKTDSASQIKTSNKKPLDDESDIGPEYGDFRCVVNAKPFGMHLNPSGDRPVVHNVVKGLPAHKAGVLKGDVLITIAGVRIDKSNWFAAFEQAVPPFGLRFRRKGAPREADAEEVSKGKVGKLDIIVSEKPFGMHVKQGTATVEEVFPGFPATKVGVHTGCTIVKISGYAVSPGTWLKVFEKQIMPFNMSFYCAPPLKQTSAFKSLAAVMPGKTGAADSSVPSKSKLFSSIKKGAASAMKALSNVIPSINDKQEKTLRVLMVERPFGMNVQVNVVPRVVEVLPGYPAEKVGVKRGFVLKEVGNKPVNINTWNSAFMKCKLPCPLTFETKVPVHKDNPFFAKGREKSVGKGKDEGKTEGNAKGKGAVDLKALRHAPDFKSVRVLVTKIPFGIQVSAPPGGMPTVQKVERGFEAHRRGVQIGDVLVEVAGLPVDSSSWFQKFSQASPPFGLKFRRRIFVTGNVATNKKAMGATLAMQNIFFRNQYRQSWNATLRKKAISIASKLRAKGAAAIKSYFQDEEDDEETEGGEDSGGTGHGNDNSKDVRLLAAVTL